MSENEFKRVLIAVCFVVAAIVGGIAAYNIYVTRQIAGLIEGGVAPIEARCALAYNSLTCPNR